MIEVSIVGGKQSRFSTIEFEKSMEGCTECEGFSCGKGLCSGSTFYDKSFSGGWGARGLSPWENEFPTEEPQSSLQCACDLGVEGDSCKNGTCATVNCNEPFGGFCSGGACTCIDGYSGDNCEVAPVRDKFGCYPDYVVSGKLMVSTLCLPELIAGPAGHGNLFRGPSPMSAVADKLQPDTVYFSWTPDAKYGKAGVPVLENSYAFNGFARAGGIDMTEDGIVGTLCAKLWYPWVEHTNSHLDKAAMVLAVCEVNASSMTKHRTPWQIGKQYQESVTAPNTGIWGSYPLSAWFAQRSVGYGYLIYAPAQQMWTAWYGATVDYHTGFAMHTYHRDAPGISDEEYAKYKYPVPREQVEPREEADGPWRDHHRTGTGDHQASAARFYHPRLKDIGLQKNTHWEVYMQQYGLAEDPIGMPPAGEFASPGHKGSRLELVHGNDTGRQANALRPCGDDWIIGLISDQGNVCAKVTRLGEIVTWKVIEPLVAGMPCGSSGGNCGDGAPGRMVRIAPLGAAEDAALCGSEARFLFGYEKPDRSRWLVELDGNCEEISEKMDVTRYTHWPLYQDWTTTRDGSVVWISAWCEDVKGDHGPPGSPNGVWPYKFRSLDAEGEYLFGLTPEATNAAKVTVYYPNAIAASITTKPSVSNPDVTSTLSTVGDSSSTPITDPSSVDAPTDPTRTDELSTCCPYYSPVAAVALIALLATLTM